MKFNKYYLILIFSCLLAQADAQSLKVSTTYVNLQHKPHCIEDLQPAFGWQLISSQQNVIQVAYQLFVGSDSIKLNPQHRIQSQSSLQNRMEGRLESAAIYFWKVKVWDNLGNVAESRVERLTTGLVRDTDWKGASWIGYEKMPDTLITVPAIHQKGNANWQNRNDILPLLRKSFSCSKQVKQATAYVSGLGQFEFYCNGKKQGDHFLDPGWTHYQKTAQYLAFDLTREIKKGNNALGVMLGNGFFFVPGQRYRKLTGGYGYPMLKLRLSIVYNDGSKEDIISDPTWKATPGSVTFTSIYGGEDYDAQKEIKGWNQATFNSDTWSAAVLVEGPQSLKAMPQEPLKKMQVFQARSVKALATGSKVYDFGQNFSGITSIHLKGHRGDTIRIRTAELLNADGSINQKPIGSPVVFTYICKGGGSESWEPRFTYHGFRYAQVDISPGGNQKPEIINLTGIHTRNSAKETGSFTSSDSLFNKTFEMIRWAVRSNMASVLTDCPHREKLGWLEQTHLMAHSIALNYNMVGMYRKIVQDMIDAQSPDGRIPEYAPEYVDMPFMGGIFQDSPEWGSASVLVPWFLYEWYGDKASLTRAWPMMKKFISHLEDKAKDNILAYGLSDWYDLGPEKPGLAQLTPMGLTGTAIYYDDLRTMSKAAAKLGYIDDSLDYLRLADTVREAFNRKFFHQDSAYYGTNSQTANAMALALDLVPVEYEEQVMANLIHDLENRNYQLTSGDIGFHYLVEVLDKSGRSDLLFKMNHRSDVPGYGYQIKQGATALTESWQALPTVSNNHLMLGHLMQWFYEGLGGITADQGSISFDTVLLRPQITRDIKWVRTGYESLYGRINSSWSWRNRDLVLDISIPANTTAVLKLPLLTIGQLYVNGKPEGLQVTNGKQGIQLERRFGSGNYQLIIPNYLP